ncbi:MAG TPA: PKD domain-containing protein, partial [Acidimicrobiia bacterium]|nr:PKD domain-containing protein [Acidimicrobiia bacterium]
MEGRSHTRRRASWRAGALVTALTSMLAGLALVPADAATPPTVGVSVAYADTHHGSGGQFPSPWMQSPGITFVGTAQRWDAGAIRVDNASSSPLTGVTVTVDIGRKHFALWPAGLTIPAQGGLILTETKSGNFDTSELSSPGSCTTPSSVVPLVNVTVGGSTTTYRDSGQVLNTGGVDREKCPAITDESHQWQSLAAPAAVDAPPTVSLSVAPATGSTPLAVVADASSSTDADATPIASYRFDFGDGTVVGPQATASAMHTYTTAGPHSVTVTVADTGGASAAQTAPVTAIGFPGYVIDGHDATTASAGRWNLLDVGLSTIGNVPSGSGLAGMVWLGDFDKTTCSFAVSDSTVTSAVSLHKGDARVFGYFIADEPDSGNCAGAAALLRARTDLIHSIDPGARTFAVFSQPATFPGYVATVDIAATDPYPCKPSQPCDTTMIPAYAAAMKAAGATNWWGVLQAFGSGGWRWPTGDEEHAMIRQWCAAGVAGTATFAWTWSGENLSDHPDVLREIQDLNTRGCSAFTDDPPVVALAVQLSSGGAPLAVTADASGSTDTDATPIATYSFDWGDGTTTGPQPGPTATHTYASAGSYTVTATATDSGGLAATGSAP